jgi:shikimate dehydrogenase
LTTAADVDGILNATPMGMDKFPGLPIAASAIDPRHWVAEIVYFPLETEFLAEARRKGCRTLDGSGMAVGQAADAFEIFTGKTADRRRMQASFTAYAAEGTKAAA